MACHGTSLAPGQVDAAFVCVVFADMPAPIGNSHPVTHCVSAEPLELAMLQIKSRNVLGPTFGLPRLQQTTRARSQGKVGSAF